MSYDRLRRAWRRLGVAPLMSRIRPVVKARFGERTVLVDLRDQIIGRPFFVYGRYEVELQRLMSHMNLRGGVCVDVGANIGLHTLVMSELVGDAGQVIAFEPEAHNFGILERNLAMNRRTNVRALNFALSDKQGTARFELSDTNFGDHRMASGGAAEGRSSQQVQVTTLDHALADLPDNAVRFIKVDVQGHEMHALRGMTQTLRRNRDAILMVEVSPGILPQFGCTASALVSDLYERGFSGWELLDHRIFPSLSPWLYDLIREPRWADLILSRNETLLRDVMSAYCGRNLDSAEPRENRAAARAS